MAALSYYSSCDSWWDVAGTDDDPELQSLHDTWNANYSVDLNALFENNYCNSSFLPYHLNNGVPNSSLLPYDFNNGVLNSHHFNYPELECSFNYPKRQRLSPAEILMPEFQFPVKKEEACGGGGGGLLSAQSMAARQRQRRITDKTRELGKLVPGGQKMNKAEMLSSAHKYIKFMQAQVAILQFIAKEEAFAFEGEEELQKLLESPLIQEKLYSTEHCLLPHKFKFMETD